ncbi:subtilase [Salinadaptatus halalkaliphilus]|uniref:Subtilase n=1 Tax=Salinadaptatus halalkaliphilus TaxID=2419781 RepID=A0A4S3TMW2_9EURY|nr:S8 family serine peptidase [Salinadaptatus halalkaliphilus]THE65572.1 subtilase [Salinadaptatus halalkaliphilus]
MGRTKQVAVLVAIVLVVSSLAGGLAGLAISLESTAADAELGEPTVQTEAVHETGITGENVSVGILDVTGFDAEQPLLEDRVVTSRGFGDGVAVDDPTDNHGTAAAITVARTAPDAELYLGTVETPADYAAGLEWLVEEDVDVVVTPVVDAGTVGDGTADIARSTTAAIDQGVIVVAPVGNIGDGHWIGTYDPDEDGVHSFDHGPLNGIDGQTGHAEFHLAWNDPDESYHLELHRLGDDGTTDLVARSLPREHRPESAERLTVRLEDDRYALVVRGPGAGDGTNTTVRIASPTHSLDEARSERSVTAPATAPEAIAVGAYDPSSESVAPFSSRGPTTDGRLGVYVVAPSGNHGPGTESFEGTSASAAYVGGVVALVCETAPDLEPRDVRWTIASSAEPIDGVDAESGHGVIDPLAAVQAADSDREPPPEAESADSR